MAIDTPARLAILGAGPIGLEAALYARFLGYDVVVYERGHVAEKVRQAGSAALSKPFRDNRTLLGLAALQAQDEAYVAPPDDAMLTCQEWCDRYLIPLAGTDLISDHLRLHTKVVSIGQDDTEEMFQIRATTPSGHESVETFDGVLDCSGLDSNPAWNIPEALTTFFHVLGSKTAGNGDFPAANGHEQIRAAFAVIGDRENLDLYVSAARLLR